MPNRFFTIDTPSFFFEVLACHLQVIDRFDQFFSFFALSILTLSSALSINLGNINYFFEEKPLGKISGMPRIKPGVAGWEARMLSTVLCGPSLDTPSFTAHDDHYLMNPVSASGMQASSSSLGTLSHWKGYSGAMLDLSHLNVWETSDYSKRILWNVRNLKYRFREYCETFSIN